MIPHQQTWVKVNAPVDCGIAALVSALSSFGGLETIESCQGVRGQTNAFVLFRYGNWEKCGEFLFDRLLPTLPPDLRGSTRLSLEALDTDNVIANVTVEAEAIEALVQSVLSVAEKANDRRNGCCGDT